VVFTRSGLRANLLRSYTGVVNAAEFDKCSKLEEWKKLLFGLCFFHGTVQERKKFGPLGWNKSYEFNDSDLETSVQVLRMFLDEQPQVPWDALRYVCGHINYGGRVTDDWDRRCLMTILQRFFTTDILKDEYTFSASGKYKAPKNGELSSYLAYLEQLPLKDEPEIFGMHENANITFQRQEADRVLSTIVSIQPREVAGGTGKSADQVVASLAESIETKLPALLDRKEAGAATFQQRSNGVMDSLATVLGQEMERFNRLLRVMRSTLAELQRAIRGEVVMSLELDKMYSSLLNGDVPEVWARVAYPSLKPLALWVQVTDALTICSQSRFRYAYGAMNVKCLQDLHARVEFIRDWLRHGQPLSFWMSGFFFPQVCICSFHQTVHRRDTDLVNLLRYAGFLDWRLAELCSQVSSPD